MDQPKISAIPFPLQHPQQPKDKATADVNFAFLVHSQDSLGTCSPPDIDNQRLARQKRRRTSPEDQAILEAEYHRDPKPDKSTRLEIVKRVALREKEVQIWFQNRRQLTRRKSQPPSLLESSQNSTQEDHSFARPDNSIASSASDVLCLSSSQNSLSQSQTSDNSQEDSRIDEKYTHEPSQAQNREDKVVQPEAFCQTFKMDSQGKLHSRNPPDKLKRITPGKQGSGYLANRRSAPFIIHEDVDNHSGQQTSLTDTTCKTAIQSPQHQSDRPLRRTMSLVKLSMDSEGKAEVAPRTGETPSPPRAPTVMQATLPAKRHLGLQRSYSAIEPGANYAATGCTVVAKNYRQSLGRSKDARTWEFYCDSNAREALTKQAEKEETGSAAAAIDLIRSCNAHRKALVPNPNKRNAQAHKHEPTKRYKPDSEISAKPKLERAISSVARLQSTDQDSEKSKTSKPGSKHKKSSSQSLIFEDFEGDSDKENWQPGTQARALPRRRPVTTQETARILLESLQEPSQSGRRQRRVGPVEKFGVPDKENAGPRLDHEATSFAREESLPREEEDLDCVQSLLSLSQAAWIGL